MGMDSELTARISTEHLRHLAWFEEHQDEVSPSPSRLEGGLRLVSTPKGIYKPADLRDALSIKINLDSPYADGVPVPTPGRMAAGLSPGERWTAWGTAAPAPR